MILQPEDMSIHLSRARVPPFGHRVRGCTHTSGLPFGRRGCDYPRGWRIAAPSRAIIPALRARWPDVKRVTMLHRIGRLEIGESSVLIAVSCPHRGQAFEACRFAIDTLKETVPVWKKEYFEDGEVWVGLQGG